MKSRKGIMVPSRKRNLHHMSRPQRMSNQVPMTLNLRVLGKKSHPAVAWKNSSRLDVANPRLSSAKLKTRIIKVLFPQHLRFKIKRLKVRAVAKRSQATTLKKNRRSLKVKPTKFELEPTHSSNFRFRIKT